MKFEEALEIISKEFETRRIVDTCHSIVTGMSYDGAEGFHVALYVNAEGEAIISDLGGTKNFFYHEITLEEWEVMCRENGMEFINGSIVRRFKSMKDLFEYIDFLDRISDKYFTLN